MLKNEAIWFGSITKNLDAKKVLDISGGSWFFRNIRQPYIEKYIFSNFKKITRTDINNDVCSSEFSKIGKFDLVFANNVLEHVVDYKKASKNISKVVSKGGYLAVSVPKNFPYHADPIDNGFRPNPKDLLKLFPDFKIIKSKIVKQKYLLMLNRSSIFWFNKTFSASCLVLKKVK
jgi:SAM-dependent methyltransferase